MRPWPPWCSGGLRGVTGDRTDCSHGYSFLKMTRVFIRKIHKNSECYDQGDVEVQLDRRGHLSVQCEDGWQRLGSGGQFHQHSTQTWCSHGQLLQV